MSLDITLFVTRAADLTEVMKKPIQIPWTLNNGHIGLFNVVRFFRWPLRDR